MRYLLIILSIFLSANAFAAEVTLRFDANTESDLLGYKVYYTDNIDMPKKYNENISKDVTEYTVENLKSETEYYFHITAWDTELLESDDSNTVSTVTDKLELPEDNLIEINAKPLPITITIKIDN